MTRLETMQKLIMHIDDCKDEFEILEHALKQHNLPYHCVWAPNAEEAERMLREILPDLIILDYNMPGRNGISCLLAFRKLPKLDNTPVMLYTSSLNESICSQARAGGAICLEKSASVTNLLRTISNILE